MLVKDVYAMLDQIAPFADADANDNVGLLLGSPLESVTGVMVALDVTQGVIEQMWEKGANLLITHHPLMHSPVKRLLDTEYEGHLLLSLARARIAFIAAHTNWDKAVGGTNDTLCRLFGLTDIAGEGYIRVGTLPEPLHAMAFKEKAEELLHAPVVLMGDEAQLIARVGVCSGGGSDEWVKAKDLGADAFLTGEIKHHHALEATANGMALYAAGHFATEDPGMDALCASLQTKLNEIECNVAVYRAQSTSYAVR